MMKGGTIAIFGATQYVGSWFARPVQWNGLAYASALLELAKYDNTLPWKHFAEMITISGMNEQSTREADYGCYTDNWGVIDSVECVGCMLSPGGLLDDVLEILEAPTSVQTEVVAVGDKRVVIDAAPRIAGAGIKDGVLQFSLKYYPGETAQTAVMPIAEPTQIEVDGAELAKRAALADVAEGWSYAPDTGCVTIKLGFGKSPRQVRVIKAVPMVPGTGVSSWEFDREGAAEGWQPAHGVTPFVVKGGSLCFSVSGDDPYIVGPSVLVNAAEHPGVVFRAKVTGRGGQLFFGNQNGGAAPERSVSFDIPADGQFHEVTVDLSAHPEWKGLITQIRLDFADAPCEVELDWVRFLGKGK